LLGPADPSAQKSARLSGVHSRAISTSFREIDAIFIWGLSASLPCLDREQGLSRRLVLANSHKETAVVGSNPCRKSQSVYLYEYKELICFVSTVLDRGRLAIGKNSGNAPQQVLAMVL